MTYVSRVNDEDGNRETGEYDTLSDAIEFAELNCSHGFNSYVTDENGITVWPKIKRESSFLSH